MKRRSKIEIEISKLFKEIGTIFFSDFETLTMMLGRNDRDKVFKEVKKIEANKKIYLDFEGNTWRMDYIPF